MTSLVREPFCFSDLRGSSWYHRFVAEEFYIFLDHYPEKKIIEDTLVTSAGLYPRNLIEEYRNNLLSYFLKGEGKSGRSRNSKTPLQILVDLRSIRKTLIPDFNTTRIHNIESYRRNNFVFSVIHPSNDLSSPIQKLKELHPGYRVTLTQALRKRLKSACRILFIPGSATSLEGELSILQQMTRGFIEILPVTDSLLPGVTSEHLQRIISISENQRVCYTEDKIQLGNSHCLNLSDDELSALGNRDGKGGGKYLLFTTNIWFYLSVLHRVKEIGFFLTNREWFSRGLFQESWDESNDYLSGMKQGSYRNMVKPTGTFRGVLLAGLQNRPFPKKVNISGVGYTSLGLSGFLEGKTPESLEKRFFRQSCLIRENLPGLKFESQRYSIDPQGLVRKVELDEDGVLITSLLIPEKSTVLESLFYSSCVPPEDLMLHGQGFLCPFNYYFTSNLVKLYNEEARSGEELQFENFFIDYLGKLIDNKWNETIPLYSKAFLGCTRQGRLFAGHYPLERVSLFLGEKEIFFPPSRINPEHQTREASLYLPSCQKESVGEGRICLVLVQDQLVYLGPGPCQIPPAGTVVVLDFPLDEVPGEIRWKTVLGGLPFPKSELSWLTGGFNILYSKGENLYPNLETGRENLVREGWYTAASRKTQETQLDPGKRQPRVVLGRTREGSLILALFSGRTKVSYGATFSEMVTHTLALLPPGENLEFLMNLDGGASASIIYYKNDLRINTGLTAPSFTNPAGVPRRLSGYLLIKINTTSGEELC